MRSKCLPFILRTTLLFWLAFSWSSSVKSQTYFSNPFTGSYWQPSFGINVGTFFNTQDIILDFGLGYEELGYDFSVRLNGSFRPYYKDVRMLEKEMYFYELGEKIIQFSLDLEKQLYFLHYSESNKFGIYGKLKAGYFWGTYNGLSKKRNQQFALNPGVGLAWRFSKYTQLSVGYLYFNQNPSAYAHTLNVSFNIFLSNHTATEK